jgi:hypothetical protein
MATLVLEQNHELDGLDQLVRCINRGTQILHVEPWISRALFQVEQDDTLDPRSSDQLAEILTDAHEAHLEGLSTEAHFQLLCDIYDRGRRGHGLKDQWMHKKDSLTEADISTELWVDFRDVLNCLEEHDFDSAQAWIEETETRFLAIWEDYEGFDILEKEITNESVLGHHFLRDGVECWLEALAMLSELPEGDSTSLPEICRKAAEGQRLLVLVQHLEESVQADRDFYFARLN